MRDHLRPLLREGPSFSICTRDQVRWNGTHPKIVYHKDGNFNSHLAAATPAGITFDPNA